MQSIGIRALACAWALAGCVATPEPVPDGVPPSIDAPPSDPGNVLVVLIDDIGTEDLAVYGPALPVTPTIDSLATKGMVFTNAYAAPMCSPTRAELLTGRHGRRYGIGDALWIERDDPELPLRERTIPEMLEAAPDVWATAHVGKWHVSGHGEGAASHPNLQGFPLASGTLFNPAVSMLGADHPLGYFEWEQFEDGEVGFADGYLTTRVADDAIEVLEDLPEPWFVHLAFNSAHFPLHAPPEELLNTPLPPPEAGVDRSEALYVAMIEALDTELGRVLDSLDPAVRERTTIILASDNGTTNPAGDPARQKGSMWEGGVHVPLIISGPEVRPGTVSSALTHTVDLYPTIANLAAVDLTSPDQPRLDGFSLLGELREPNQGHMQRRFVFTERFANGEPPSPPTAWLVRNERFKLMQLWMQQPRLFDLAADPAEAVDLLADPTNEQERIASDLREALEEMVAQVVYEAP
ncbi:MAG: sulfatase-like hydrolase/transferase [Myxococcota bacterium]